MYSVPEIIKHYCSTRPYDSYYLYDTRALRDQCRRLLSLPSAYGLTVRYAMKANSNPELLQIIAEEGLSIDACSNYEALHAIACGIAPQRIQVSSQQVAKNYESLVDTGVKFVACSLHQLESYCSSRPGTSIGLRVNPGQGSGAFQKVNTGGLSSSFGLWYAYIPEALHIAKKYHCSITTLHTHIGSGTDPEVWLGVVKLSLLLLAQLPDVHTLDLGGGFKVARVDEEEECPMEDIFAGVASLLEQFAAQTSRKIQLEIEPGTFVVANSGYLVCRVDDIVDTGTEGYNFLKLNIGMTEIMRPTMYGAQHPIAVLTDTDETRDYVVVGHCCESSDCLTVEKHNPSRVAPRCMLRAQIGDTVVIGGAGAYCASMAAKGYNGYPEIPEILL